MKKQKILIVVHQLNIGGVQKSLISALNALDYSKNDVTLYIRKDRVDLLPMVNRNVSEIIVNKNKTRYYRKPYAVWLQLLELITKNKKYKKKLFSYIDKSQMRYEKKHYFSNCVEYDIVISYIQSYTARFVAENIDAKRKIMFFHGSTDELHDINEQVIPKYEKVYCVSKGAQEAVKGFYSQFAHKIDCLENYVDAEVIIGMANKFTPSYPKDKTIICTCGRITKVKGFDLAVGVAEILKNQGLQFKWYFIGDGAERENIQRSIDSKELTNEIEITGILDNPYPYIKNCNIYVQPSYEESFGLTIVEAKALDRPIISTATVGAMDVIRDSYDGLLADTSAESLAETIVKINDDKKLQDTIVRNLEKIDYTKDYQRFRNDWKRLLEG